MTTTVDLLDINEHGETVALDDVKIQLDQEEEGAPSGNVEVTLRRRCKSCAMDIADYPRNGECPFCHAANLGTIYKTQVDSKLR